MFIESYLNPIEDDIIDSNEGLTEQIVSHFDPLDADNSDEEVEILPKVAIHQATEALSWLRLFEEQQEASNHSFMEQMNLYEEYLTYKKCLSRQQAYITKLRPLPRLRCMRVTAAKLHVLALQ